MDDGHHWVTVHRVRFPNPISALERTFETPRGPECWRFCPSQKLNDENLPSWTSDVWGGLGIHTSYQSAHRFASAPGEHLPFLKECVEDWHALMVPIAHKGMVNWRGEVEDNSALLCADRIPDGELVVVTTAGFNSGGTEDFPRIAKFSKGIEEAIGFLAKQHGNLRRDVFNGEFDGREGFTVSLWRDDDAMTRATYQEGLHRRLMDESRTGSMFDRSSFSRFRLIANHGDWDGDPLAA